MTGTRIDKWLWAARFFKTRELASKACDMNRIQSNGQSAKPSREVKQGDRLTIKNEAGEHQIEVLIVSHVRGSAEIARTLYSESDESREARRKAAEERKAQEIMDPFRGNQRPGRPTKRDRRLIHGFLDKR
jgi:ribosome-associated heat shock protein Hsp15